jgi:Tfp pilus tip-associated adhesin PilY1
MLNKKTLITSVIIINMIIYFCAAINVWAQDPGDEQETFSSLAPDALILLDLSGSMAWNPAGGDNIWGDSTCAGPTYYSSSGAGHNVNCSRLAIAKRALANILDDDSNNAIDSQDVKSLNIRIGFARFYNGTYQTVRGIGTSYAQIFCGATGTGASCATTANSCVSGECIAGESATGGTPLASSLGSVKSYLDTHKAADAAGGCRSKFVVVITDGADTYACGGDGAECQSGMYKRRRAVVAAAKTLKDAGYKVFVIGFGAAMPDYLENTLNWMAYYGGTDNPDLSNTGDTSAYTNVTTCDDAADQTATCQGDSTAHFQATNNDPGYIPLSGYAFLAGNADDLNAALKSAFSAISASTYSFTQASIQAVRTVDENFVYEASFQPVDYDPFWIGHLKRYSILSDGSVKATEDWDAGDILSNKAGNTRNVWAYKSGSLTSFTSATITAANLSVTTAAQRDAVINFIRDGETSGSVADWKLGDVFHTSPMSIATPNFLFYDQWDKSNPKAFNTYRLSHIRTSANGKRIIIVGSNDGQLHAFKTGEASSGGGAEVWSFIPPNFLPKLKTIAHSSHPTALGHQYFVDGPLSAAEIWLGSGTIGSTYKSSDDWHTYLVMAEGRGGSTTLWSSSVSCDTGFNAMYSSTYPHYCGYYAFKVDETLNNPVYQWRLGGSSGLSAVDGSHLGQPWSKMFIGRVRINNTEKWVGFIGGGYSGTDCAGGGACDKRGKGFYVVDLSNGQIIWRYTHSGPAEANSIADGAMNYNLASSPVAVDTDNDGFLDTAYIPDLGGNVWRFKLCSSIDGAGCNTSNWSGGLFYDSTGNVRPIYTSSAVSTDNNGNLWVYFGSGDKTDPTAPNAQERFYAVKDNNRTSTYTVSDLENINTGTYSGIKNGWFIPINGQGEKILADPTIFEGNVYFTTYKPPSGNDLCQQGGEARLYIVNYITGAGVFSTAAAAAATANAAAAAAAANAATAAAAAAANPTAANIAAATAANAAAASAAAASVAANAAAASASTVRSEVIGQGVSSAAVISRNPGDVGGKGVFVSTSIVGAGGTSNTRSVFDPTFTNNPPNSLIYWHDLRVR